MKLQFSLIKMNVLVILFSLLIALSKVFINYLHYKNMYDNLKLSELQFKEAVLTKSEIDTCLNYGSKKISESRAAEILNRYIYYKNLRMKYEYLLFHPWEQERSGTEQKVTNH